MQLIGLQGETRIPASLALKGKDYLCPECRAILRRRSGPRRQPHFYHFSKNSSCAQSGKTLQHLHTQLYIQKNLPHEEAQLEVPFPSISRIADVVWNAKKIIFEVQCSPISREEVEKRNRDYESLGFCVVWILHEDRFNQRFASPAEEHLLGRDVYFSSLDVRGLGSLYDQFSLVRSGRRRFHGVKLPIVLSLPYWNIPSNHEWPQELLRRASSKKLGFQGDLLDRLRDAAPGETAQMHRLEQRLEPSSKIRTTLLWIRDVYGSFLHALLEKHSL